MENVEDMVKMTNITYVNYRYLTRRINFYVQGG